MTQPLPRFNPIAAKTVIVHTVSYFIAGILAATYLDYASVLARPDMACWMRQINDPILRAAVLFQPIRGLVFALAIYPLREIIFSRRQGWLLLWWLLVALGILSTFGPIPGSIEGLVFTVIPIQNQLTGYLEVVPQAFLLAFGVFYWVNHPEKRWLTRIMVFAFAVVILLPILGLWAASRGIR